MKVIVVGLGTQRKKRQRVAGADYVASVDPGNAEADYHSVQDVPLADYDAALACLPDEPKLDIIRYFLNNGKHVLVEKPLWAPRDTDIEALEKLARAKGAVLYTAYNHRFEPHFVRMRDLIASGKLGTIYSCRMFYGNGTARIVRDSDWRDTGAGVLPDLGSHLLDTCRFLFGDIPHTIPVIAPKRLEKSAPDHVIIGTEKQRPRLELEMTLCMWHNHFTCDILADKGSAHIESLCKWGPSSFIHRQRVLPSGRPTEEVLTLPEGDPTWALEYAHFKNLCRHKATADLSNDLWLCHTLQRLAHEATP
jgi:scyllo-inositol 2-dehydrogenase (NADP+)